MLGLAVLFGSSGVSFALSKIRPGKTYCDCGCKTFSRTTELNWEKVASCSVNGKKCRGTNSAGQVEDGELVKCQQCTGGQGGYTDCTPAAGRALEGLSTSPGLIEPGDPAPPTAPYSKSEMNKRVMSRGVEGEAATSAPAGQVNKDTAPK
jgi:hypothetical protein